MTGGGRLREIARHYRGRRLAGAMVLALGTAALAAGIARLAGGGAIAIAAALIAGSATFGWRWWEARRKPIDGQAVAQHFDRTHPEFEESTELLLHDAESLPFVARLEHARVEAAFGRAPVALPPDEAARRWITGGVLAGLCALGLLLLPVDAPTAVRAGAGDSSAAGGPPAVRGATIRVDPPRYTGIAATETRAWDLDVADGSVVRWEIDTDADRGWIVTTAHDTVALAGGSDRRTATLHATTPALYQVIVERGGRRTVSDFHRLGVRADAPPLLSVVAPHGRTELSPGTDLSVPVEILAGDDYGVASARLVATLTSGEGEAVKFREQTIALGDRRPSPAAAHGASFRTTLDLRALGLKPGDELYFHVEASDNRTPSANVARSETVFLSITDTSRTASATIAGIALRLMPEFFRSERQIIIDTEKLLADRPRIPLQAFRDRANAIGIDQGLLRARYGQFLGDEVETGEDPMTEHQHDTPENATLLAGTVKAKLKSALDEMWQAELRLRTYRPSEALDFEYRALGFLKEAQQADRVYVQRVGFEPTPLDPERTRLTGKLDAIASRTDRDSVAVPPSLPAVRAALLALGDARGATALGAAQLVLLERAELELAPLAAADPRHFSTVQAIRTLLVQSRAGARCDGCAARVARGLLLALPAASSTPVVPRDATSPAARRYFDRLDAGGAR